MATGLLFGCLLSLAAASPAVDVAAQAVPHDGNAYCLPGNIVTGLPKDGPAQPLQQCFHTLNTSTPAPGKHIFVGANDSLVAAWSKAECGDQLHLDPNGWFYI